jgi:precorrin-3B synthase
MTAHAQIIPQRRGVCPGLSKPMLTGDGQLVRFLPAGTISLPAFAGLCAAGRRHGTGIIEITSRGSIQVRGLSEGSAPRFAAEIAELGIAAEGDVPIHCNPLSGWDAEEIFDAAVFVAELRRALAQQSFLAKLGPKISVAIDGGGQVNIAGLPADIRLCAQAARGGIALHVSVGGNDAGAALLGAVAPPQGIEAAVRLLGVIAHRGPQARAREILANEGPGVFRSAIAEFLFPASSRRSAPRSPKAIGTHDLRDGSLACGIGLAFGHSDAHSFERLADAVGTAGASGVRAASGRILIALGLASQSAPDFLAAAAGLGFVTQADDPRRRVVACAGAPICASAHIASRAIAPRIAHAVASHGNGLRMIHISGCAKGCAHAAPAALTIVGTAEGCALIANGCARDAPFTLVAADELPDAIARFSRGQSCEAGHV